MIRYDGPITIWIVGVKMSFKDSYIDSYFLMMDQYENLLVVSVNKYSASIISLFAHQ